MVRGTLWIVLVVLTVLGSSPRVCAGESGEMRTWTMAGGKSFQARFVEMEGAVVVIANAEGKLAKVPLNQFSLVDRFQLQEWGKIEANNALRRWQSKRGSSVVGELTGFDGDQVVLSTGAREFKIAKRDFVQADQEILDQLKSDMEARAQKRKGEAFSAMLTTPYGELIPGKFVGFQLPVRPEVRKVLDREKIPEMDFLEVGVALPPDFDPNGKHPIVIIQRTTDGKKGTCYSAARKYSKPGMEKSCIVIGASGPEKYPKQTYAYRNEMAQEGLRFLYETVPEAKEWPIYFAGFSGGAKWSGMLAALMTKNGYPIRGVFMAGCNEDKMSAGYDEYRPPKSFRDTPVFLSNGLHDRLASYEEWGKVVKSSMDRGGFDHVRLESYDGAHDLNLEHFKDAIDWFRAIEAGEE